MHVQLISPHSSCGADYRYSLTIDSVYEVIGICGNSYQIIEEHGEPILYESNCFQVTDPTEPACWISKMTDGVRHAHPPGWGVPGFFEAWHDDNKIVQRVFEAQLNYWFPESANAMKNAKRKRTHG